MRTLLFILVLLMPGCVAATFKDCTFNGVATSATSRPAPDQTKFIWKE